MRISVFTQFTVQFVPLGRRCEGCTAWLAGAVYRSCQGYGGPADWRPPHSSHSPGKTVCTAPSHHTQGTFIEVSSITASLTTANVWIKLITYNSITGQNSL